MLNEGFTLNEGLFSSDLQDKATNSNFTLGSLIMDNHRQLHHARNRKEADIRHFIRKGEFPEREEEKENEEEREAPKLHGDYIERRQILRQFQNQNSVKEETITMASYKDHLLTLDEAQMGKVPGTANIHHVIAANDMGKKMTGGYGLQHKVTTNAMKKGLGQKGYEANKLQSKLQVKHNKILNTTQNDKANSDMTKFKTLVASAEVDPRLTLFEQNSTPHGTQNDGVAMGVGLGKPHDDGNHLFNIKINDYQASDANFVGDGEEAATSQTNIPAILAAKQAGGDPDPKTVSNGINKRFSLNPGPSLQEYTVNPNPTRFKGFVNNVNSHDKGNNRVRSAGQALLKSGYKRGDFTAPIK